MWGEVVIKEKQKTVYVTDDNIEFETKLDAKFHEEEVEQIAKLRTALLSISDFCKWFRHKCGFRQDGIGSTCSCTHICPMMDVCHALAGTELVKDIFDNSETKVCVNLSRKYGFASEFADFIRLRIKGNKFDKV